MQIQTLRLERDCYNEPLHKNNYKMTCAPIENSGQPGHSPSLIRVVGVPMKKAWVLSYPVWVKPIKRTVKTLISETLLGTKVSLLVLSCSGSNAVGKHNLNMSRPDHEKENVLYKLLRTMVKVLSVFKVWWIGASLQIRICLKSRLHRHRIFQMEGNDDDPRLHTAYNRWSNAQIKRSPRCSSV